MRTQRWLDVHADLAKWWHEVRATRGRSLAKGVDAQVAWYAHSDLRSIHANEYRRADDAEVREALRQARAATTRLSELLWQRVRRLRRERGVR